jgi:hypothetical protein
MDNKARPIEDVLLDYRRDLKVIHDMLQSRHHQRLAEVIETWLSELSVRRTNENLSRHAKRAIRALGGMESVGEIALASGDKTFLAAVESLYNSATTLKDLCE